MWNDLRYALRTLRQNPGFTAVAALALALGIGANTAIFSVVDGVLLKPLPYSEPRRLVRVFETNRRFPKWPISPANFLDHRERSQTLEALAIYTRRDLELSGDRPERLRALRVSSGFFELLGFQAALGRTFRREDELPDNHRVVVLSHGLWQQRFSGDAGVIGRSISISGEAHTIIGVMPPGVQHVGGEYRSLPHGENTDAWWPFTLQTGKSPRGQHFLNAVGRLKPGVTPAAAESEMNVLAASLEKQYPNTNQGWRIRVSALDEEIVGGAKPLLVVLLGAVGVVLLIACVNVANLLLARATGRTREMAVRAALGASRGRLMRQLLTESLLIAVAGGVAGMLLGLWGVDALVALSPDTLPRTHMIGIDVSVMLFTASVTLLAGLLFGLAPALELARSSLNEALQAGGRGSGAGARHARMRNVLVVAEVALAFVLTIGAGLLLRSFVNLMQLDAGFSQEKLLTFSVELPRARYAEGRHVAAFYDRLLERLATLPGVRSSGATSDLPWTGYDENMGFAIEHRPIDPKDAPHGRYHYVTAGYFPAIGVPLLRGRWFTSTDTAGAPPAILINQAMAKRYWPNEDPVGRRITFTDKPAEKDMFRIVGVVGDVKDTPQSAGAEPAFYWPHAQQQQRQMFVALQVDSDPLAFAEPVRREISQLDKDLPIADVRPMTRVADASVATPRFALLLVGVFAGLAVLLAGVGIYGVMAYSVGQRTREIGVRVALGARPADVLSLVVRQGFILTATGLALGLALAVGLTRAMTTLLYGVSPADPVTFAIVAALLLLFSLTACYLPARRATRVDPMVALRHE